MIEIYKNKLGSAVLFCRVWSFLKFHHRAFTDGFCAVDDFFFAAFPEAADHPCGPEFLSSLIKRIDGLDDAVTTIHPAKRNLTKQRHAGLEWILELGDLSPALSARLFEIYENRSGRQHYVERSPWGANVAFKGEQENSEHPLWMALAVTRYWSALEYFYPYRALLGDWEAVLAEALLPAFRAEPGSARCHEILLGMCHKTKDGHAALFTQQGAPVHSYGALCLPIGLRSIEGDMLVSGSAEPSVSPGARLIAVEGEPLGALKERFQPSTGVGGAAALDLQFARSLVRGDRGGIRLIFETPEGRRDVSLTYQKGMNRWVWPVLRGTAVQWFDRVAYLQFVYGDKSELEMFLETGWKHARGIIIDLRCYPRFGFDQLVPRYTRPDRPFARGTFLELSTPGKLRRTAPIHVKPKGAAITTPTVVLIDAHSASHPEYFAMAMRAADTVTLMGQATAGADGNRSFVPLPDGTLACFSGYGVTYPDGEQTQIIGIQPDIICAQTQADTQSESDTLILRALAFLEEKSHES